MLIGSNAARFAVFADDSTPTPSDTPQTQQTTVTNTSSSDTTANTTADTGNNTVNQSSPTPADTVTPESTITPTDTPTDTPTPTPDPTITSADTPTGTPTDTPSLTPTPDQTNNPTATDDPSITNTGDVLNDSTSSANSGDNAVTVTGDSSQQSSNDSSGGNSTSPAPTPTVSVMTGTAAAITTVDNSVNTTSVNSQIINQTINLYVDQNASLDLSDPASFIAAIVSAHPNDNTINLHITSVTNQASLTNTVNSVANSGNNSATATGGAEINTGDAYSLVSLLNRVNFVSIDSIIHVITINIFGTLNGDIILPSPVSAPATDPCSACNTNFTATNSATIINSVNSQANTGDNSITATESGLIQTGDAASQVDITNLVNTTVIGGDVFSLDINSFGTWEGLFTGWGSIPSGATGTLNITNTAPNTTDSNGSNIITVNNSAYVDNSINSLANTGNNSATGGSANIQTGNALSDVSIINLVNTILYRTTAFFGFINIFGTWNGNVGDAKSLAAAEATPTPAAVQSNASSNSSGSTPQETGGQLTVTNANNVGAFVLPGDTVTFFITTKNPGTGKVYGANLSLHLFKDGVDRGGQTFSLGDIQPSHGVKLTTGFVLSLQTPPGDYVAHAVVTGTVGPDNETISASADSGFTVAGSVSGGASTSNPPTFIVSGEAPTHAQVLGATTKKADDTNILYALLVLVLLLPEYIALRALKDKKGLILLFQQSSWQKRLQAIQMLLL